MQASAEIIDFESYRRARGLPAFAAASDEADAFPWAYTFDPPRVG